MKKQLLTGLLAGGLMAAMLPGVASADAPEVFTDAFGPFTFEDEFLTEECGVGVETTVEGKVKGQFFGEDGKGVLNVFTLNVSLVARAGDNFFNFRDVGGDIIQQGPDGSLIAVIFGQVPFSPDGPGFNGALKIDLVADEVIQEPTRIVDTSRACRALTR